ncbi:hypothetical protein SS50377_26441 [Spironucleus salmonicida]|uniref:Uncharacterized protein n=1 Tax=Spironucleus salmonicida TaxID=348837 RepID=V6LCB9_9EUKA|nr:hypothetical protein SS50377_26441 [Spironucleus salmonicida]|eukprot:EST41301.1 Hypothetical protein SS50377_19014 [Spironucleus salmonicida]
MFKTSHPEKSLQTRRHELYMKNEGIVRLQADKTNTYKVFKSAFLSRERVKKYLSVQNIQESLYFAIQEVRQFQYEVGLIFSNEQPLSISMTLE